MSDIDFRKNPSNTVKRAHFDCGTHWTADENFGCDCMCNIGGGAWQETFTGEYWWNPGGTSCRWDCGNKAK